MLKWLLFSIPLIIFLSICLVLEIATWHVLYPRKFPKPFVTGFLALGALMYYTFYQWQVLYQVYTLNDELSESEREVPTESYFLVLVYLILLCTQLVGLVLNLLVCFWSGMLIGLCFHCMDPANHLSFSNTGRGRQNGRNRGGSGANNDNG